MNKTKYTTDTGKETNMETTQTCEHKNKSTITIEFRHVVELCDDCGVDMAHVWYENWIRDLEKRVENLEAFLNL